VDVNESIDIARPGDGSSSPDPELALLPEDIATFGKLGIPPELLEQARIQRVTDPGARCDWGIKFAAAKDCAGIIYPYYSPVTGRRVTARLRRDHPEIGEDGKPNDKYVSAWGDRRHLYFPPDAQAKLADPDITIVLVESEKAALALNAWAARTGAKILAIAMGGCWGWRGKVGIEEAPNGKRAEVKGPLPDLDYCDNHRIIILLDSNVATNPKVPPARAALVKELSKAGRKSKVLISDLPVVEGVNGPDDYIGARGDDAMAEVFAKAHPPARRSKRNTTDTEPRFELRDNGVFYLGVDKEGNPKPEQWVCGRLDILAQTRDGKSAEWGRLLEWRDNDGVVHTWAMPNELLQTDGAEVRAELARLGLSLAPSRYAHELGLISYPFSIRSLSRITIERNIDKKARLPSQPGLLYWLEKFPVNHTCLTGHTHACPLRPNHDGNRNQD
jgi:hypothetical protein